jgi:preprotein translocase subunit SecF
LSRHLGWRLVAVLFMLGSAGWLVVTRPARLGLDLRGGTQIVLEAKDSPEEPTTTRPPANTDELVLADEDGVRLRLGPAALTGAAACQPVTATAARSQSRAGADGGTGPRPGSRA